MYFPVHPLAFIDGIGGPEMMLILIIVLMLFGGQKLPELARGLGKSMKEFKKAASGVEEEFKRALREDEQRQTATPLITSAQPVPALPESTDSSAYSSPGNPTDESVPTSPVAPEVVAATPAPAPALPPVTPEPVKPAPAPVAAAPRRSRADV